MTPAQRGDALAVALGVVLLGLLFGAARDADRVRNELEQCREYLQEPVACSCFEPFPVEVQR